METGSVKFKRAVYVQTSTNGLKTTIDYTATNDLNIINDPLFAEIIRLELDNGYHTRSRYFEYWLYLKFDLWGNALKTGMATTGIKDVFEGNISRELHLSTKTPKGKNFETPQHLIIVQSNDLFKGLAVDIFKDFYIHDKQILRRFINDHIQKHVITKKSC